MPSRKGRWDWLHGNKFYEVTPLTGFSFINDAQTVVEEVFWYSMVIFFIIFTIYNVNSAIVSYLTYPTVTLISLSSNSPNDRVENFTFTLSTSLFEFTPQPPIILEHESLHGIKDVRCINSQATEVKNMIDVQIGEMLAGKSGTIGSKCQGGLTMNDLNHSTWLDDFLTRYRREMPRVSYTPQKNSPEWELFLVAQNVFKDFVSKWWSRMAEFYERFQNELGQLIEPNVCQNTYDMLTELMKGESQGPTTTQLYVDLQQQLTDVFIIDSDVPGTRILLRHWEPDVFNRMQKLTFQVALPKNNSQLTIHVYSTKFAYYLNVLRAITEHMRIIEKRSKESIDRGDLPDCSICIDELYCLKWDYRDTDPLDILNPDTYGVPPPDNTDEEYNWEDSLFSQGYSTMEQHYRDTTSIDLNLTAGLAQLQPFQYSHVALSPIGTFKAVTHVCSDETLSECVDKCINEQHLENCNCYPWHLEYIMMEGSARMCEDACLTTDSSHDCAKICERKAILPCDKSLFTIQTTHSPLQHTILKQVRPASHVQYLPSVPLMSVQIVPKEIFARPEFTEVFAMSFNDLISQLGGLMDLYLGINLLCILHLLVYLTRYFAQKKTGEKENSDNHELNEIICGENKEANMVTTDEKLEELRMQLDEEIYKSEKEERKHKRLLAKQDRQMRQTFADFDIKIKHLILEKEKDKKREDDENIEENEFNDGSRFWWLKGNEFFSVTPLEGYAFINEATNLTEVFFWYATIAVLTIITVEGLGATFVLYRQNPTSSSVKISFSSENATMPNFTVTLTRSLYEYVDAQDDWLLRDEGYGVNRLWTLNFPCKWSQFGLIDRIEEWLEYAVTNRYSRYYSSVFDADPAEIFKNWMKYYSSAVERGYLNWDDWHTTVLKNLSLNINKIYDEYREAVVLYPTVYSVSESEPMRYRLDQLEAQLKETARLTALSEQAGLLTIRLLKLMEQMPKHDQNSSWNDVLKAQQDWLKSSIVTVNAQVTIKDSNLDLGMLKHELELQVNAPTDHREMKFSVYSKNFSLLLTFLESLANHLKELAYILLKSKSEQNDCLGCRIHLYFCYNDEILTDMEDLLPMDGNEFEVMFNLFLRTFWELRQFYKQSMKLDLKLENEVLQLSAFENYEIELLPSGRYISMTEQCYDRSLRSCLDQCLLKQYIQNCDCWPMKLQHLSSQTSNAQLCTDSCQFEDNCQSECEPKIAHPCDLIQFRTTVLRQHIEHFDQLEENIFDIRTDLPLISFTIKMKQVFLHPMFIEEYLMSIEGLVSQLGGRMEFYLGLNVVSIVHLIVYMIRECITRRKTKGHSQGKETGPDQKTTEECMTNCSLEDIENSLNRMKKKHKDNKLNALRSIRKLENGLSSMH